MSRGGAAEIIRNKGEAPFDWRFLWRECEAGFCADRGILPNNMGRVGALDVVQQGAARRSPYLGAHPRLGRTFVHGTGGDSYFQIPAFTGAHRSGLKSFIAAGAFRRTGTSGGSRFLNDQTLGQLVVGTNSSNNLEFNVLGSGFTSTTIPIAVGSSYFFCFCAEDRGNQYRLLVKNLDTGQVWTASGTDTFNLDSTVGPTMLNRWISGGATDRYAQYSMAFIGWGRTLLPWEIMAKWARDPIAPFRRHSNVATWTGGAAVEFAATVAAVSGVSAGLAVARRFAATAAAASGVSAGLAVARRLAATAASVSGVSAGLSVARRLAATAASASGGVASLAVGGAVEFAAAVAASSAGQAALRVARRLAAAAASSSAGQAALLVVRRLAATVPGLSGGQAALDTGAAEAPGTIALTARATATIGLTARATATIALTARPVN